MTQVTRPMRPPEETLVMMGIPPRTLARWQREVDRCTTGYQIELTAQCHRMEAMIFGSAKR